MGVTWQISEEIPNHFMKICFRAVCYVQTEGRETEEVACNFYVFIEVVKNLMLKL